MDSSSSYRIDLAIILLLVALLLLLSPLMEWWAADSAPWYAPFGVWGGIIALTWLYQYLHHRHAV